LYVVARCGFVLTYRRHIDKHTDIDNKEGNAESARIVTASLSEDVGRVNYR